MTRFNRDLSERLGNDLNQISDQATPSSTAWEAILQRIDEQDSRAVSGTNPTMEVIMLDPEVNTYSPRSRTAMLVAASVAAIALVGGLLVVANRDGERAPVDRPDPVPTVPATDPDTDPDPDPEVVDGGAPEAEPDTSVTDSAPVVEADTAEVPSDGVDLQPDSGTDGESGVESDTGDDGAAPVPTPTQGLVDAECAFGEPDDRADGLRTVTPQTCDFGDVDGQPFGESLEIDLTTRNDEASESLGTVPFASDADGGYLTAGYAYESADVGRFVGVTGGTEDGEPVAYVIGIRDGNTAATYEWSLDDSLPDAGLEFSDQTSEVAVECVISNSVGTSFSLGETNWDATCTYSGGDPRFVPAPSSGSLRQYDSSLGDGGWMSDERGFSYFTSVLGADMLLSGVGNENGVSRFVSVWNGTGEFEGSLIHGIGRGDATNEPVDGDPNRTVLRGTILVSAIPAAG